MKWHSMTDCSELLSIALSTFSAERREIPELYKLNFEANNVQWVVVNQKYCKAFLRYEEVFLNHRIHLSFEETSGVHNVQAQYSSRAT